MTEQINVPASSDKLSPIYCNHIQMTTAGAVVYFDLRTILPTFGATPTELTEGTQVAIDVDLDKVPTHTRIVMPLDAVVSLRQMLLRSIQVNEQE